MYQTFIQSFSYCASSSWFSCWFNWHLLVVQGLYFRGVSIISSITPDIAWRSQTVTLWLRNCASCSPAFADLEKTPAASLPLVPAPLLALGGFCNQKWQDACINLYDQEQRGRRRKSQQEDWWQCSNLGALRTPHACFQGKGDRAGVNICPKYSVSHFGVFWKCLLDYLKLSIGFASN